jgi:hypothetical protein
MKPRAQCAPYARSVVSFIVGCAPRTRSVVTRNGESPFNVGTHRARGLWVPGHVSGNAADDETACAMRSLRLRWSPWFHSS